MRDCMPLIGDLACNAGMCPDWELNQEPFDSQAGTQFTEPHQPGPYYSHSMTPSTTSYSISACFIIICRSSEIWGQRDLWLFITPLLRTMSINVSWRQSGSQKEFGEILPKEKQLHNMQGKWNLKGMAY